MGNILNSYELGLGMDESKLMGKYKMNKSNEIFRPVLKNRRA